MAGKCKLWEIRQGIYSYVDLLDLHEVMDIEYETESKRNQKLKEKTQ